MAKLIQDIAKVINYKNANAKIEYRDVVPIGTNCIGIANMVIPQNEVGTVILEGIWELPADTSTVFNVGDILYWNIAGSKLTKTTTDIPAGMCVLKKESATTVAQIKLIFGTGIKGDKGDKGDRGPAGPKGDPGDTRAAINHVANATGAEDAHTKLNELLKNLIAGGYMKGA